MHLSHPVSHVTIPVPAFPSELDPEDAAVLIAESVGLDRVRMGRDIVAVKRHHVRGATLRLGALIATCGASVFAFLAALDRLRARKVAS